MFGKLSKKNDNGNGATSVLYTPASPLQGRPRIGWMSPEYRISRRLDLDPGVLKKNGCVSFFPETGETEFYRVLRSRILKSPIREGGKTIMVTSSPPRRGQDAHFDQSCPLHRQGTRTDGTPGRLRSEETERPPHARPGPRQGPGRLPDRWMSHIRNHDLAGHRKTDPYLRRKGYSGETASFSAPSV